MNITRMMMIMEKRTVCFPFNCCFFFIKLDFNSTVKTLPSGGQWRVMRKSRLICGVMIEEGKFAFNIKVPLGRRFLHGVNMASMYFFNVSDHKHLIQSYSIN